MTAKRNLTRLELTEILKTNGLTDTIYYNTPDETDFSDNIIEFYRIGAEALNADDTVHAKKYTIQVTHYHKKQLDSIEPFMEKTFGIVPAAFDLKQPDTDYYGTYFRFEVLGTGAW